MTADTADTIIRAILVLVIMWGMFRVAQAGHRTDQAMKDLDEAMKKFDKDWRQ